MTGFDAWIDWLLEIEGGYTSNAADPGGETNWGIAKRYHPTVDIKNLTREGAAAIYRVEYWNALQCDELPAAVAFMVADAGVNEGTGTAAKLLQRALTVSADGVIGQQTIAAAKGANQAALLKEVAARRMVKYATDPNALSFELGWARRLMSCLFEAAKLLST